MSPRGVLAAELDSLGKSPPLLEWEEISLIIEMERSCSIPFVKSSTLRRFRMEGAASLISSFTIDIIFEDESESESIVECEATELRRETFSCACVCVCVCVFVFRLSVNTRVSTSRNTNTYRVRHTRNGTCM